MQLEDNPRDLIECDLVLAAIIELCRADAFMGRHLLGVLEETTDQ